jgi:hypothetical protein
MAELKEIHFVVDHPSTGMFVARKITDPEKLKDNTYIDRTSNTLEAELKRKGLDDPCILCKRIEE